MHYPPNAWQRRNRKNYFRRNLVRHNNNMKTLYKKKKTEETNETNYFVCVIYLLPLNSFFRKPTSFSSSKGNCWPWNIHRDARSNKWFVRKMQTCQRREPKTNTWTAMRKKPLSHSGAGKKKVSKLLISVHWRFIDTVGTTVFAISLNIIFFSSDHNNIFRFWVLR